MSQKIKGFFPFWSFSFLSKYHTQTNRLGFPHCGIHHSFLISNGLFDAFFLSDSIKQENCRTADEVMYLYFSRTFDNVSGNFLEGNIEKSQLAATIRRVVGVRNTSLKCLGMIYCYLEAALICHEAGFDHFPHQ